MENKELGVFGGTAVQYSSNKLLQKHCNFCECAANGVCDDMKINSRMGTELMHPLPQTTMASARPCFRRISHALLYSLLLACVSAVDRPLEGRSLRCCTLIEPPVIFRDHTKRVRCTKSNKTPRTCTIRIGTISNQTSPSTSILQFGFNGIAMYYISLLQDKLGFNCSEFTEYVDPDDNTTSFTSFIYNMEQCTVNGEIRKQDPRCNCDIGVGGWAVNEDRKNRVDFIEPFVFDSYRVLTHIDNTHASTNSTFFLTSFSPDVWVSIFGLFVIFTLLKMLDERFAPRSNGFQPLPRDASRFRKIKHELLKSEVPYRLRHAIQSTRKLFQKYLPSSQLLFPYEDINIESSSITFSSLGVCCSLKNDRPEQRFRERGN